MDNMFPSAPGQRPVCYGQVSGRQPAPSSFTDPLFVVLPHDTDYAERIDDWPVIHGATLPALGADVLVAIDERNNWRVVWWQGIYS